MIDFYITQQAIRFATPIIAANSRDYLEARFHFSGSDWDGYSKWAHFRQGDTVYDLNLEEDRIEADMHLNLSLGQWEVFVTGNLGASRLTTVPVILTVMESGLVDEPLHQIPQSVAEQLDNKAGLALQKAAAVEAAAENGDFDGKNFQILGYYSDLEALEAAEQSPEAGDAYGIGTEAPFEIYVFDGVSEQWVNNGSIQGLRGENGAAGVTFTPLLEANGNLSWTNDGGRENPQTVNIMGQAGAQGQAGADGKTPYQLAVEEGFTGTQATFNWSQANIAGHAAQHGASGTDPLTPAMIGAAAIQELTATLSAAGWSASAPYSQSVTVTGLLATDRGRADADLAAATTEEGIAILNAWGCISRIYPSGANTLTAICYEEKPERAIPIRIEVIR